MDLLASFVSSFAATAASNYTRYSTEERYLILNMEMDVSYNESAHETVVYFDEDPDAPTVKWGWLEYTVFGLMVPFAALFVVICMCMNRRHEQHKQAKRHAERLAQYDHLRDKIKCKPWCHPDEQTRAFARSVLYGNSTTKAPFSDGSQTKPQCTVCPDPPKGVQGFQKAHNGFYCVICLDAFSDGEPVYNSNNPECRHQIHMKCMNSDQGWMSHQNICPVCHRPFVVLRPHEGDWISKAFDKKSTTTSHNRGSTLSNAWRSLRGSDNHRKEFQSVLARSTLDYPAVILEEEPSSKRESDNTTNPSSSVQAQEAPIIEEEEAPGDVEEGKA